MGHRHLFSSSQLIQADNDDGWNQPEIEQAYGHLARPSAPEGNSSAYPVELLVTDGGNSAAQWNPAPHPETSLVDGRNSAPQWVPAPRSGGYSSASLNVEQPYYQPQASGPSHDSFLHPSAAGGFHVVQENYPYHASSSNHGGHTFRGVDGGTSDFTEASGRGSFKRKSPSLPPICERGSSSRYYDNGNSSSLPMPVDPWHEKRVSDSHHIPWKYAPSQRGHSLTIYGETTPRNVRSRTGFDLEANPARAHLSTNPHNSITSLPAEHSSSTDLWGQSANALTREWNHSLVNAAGHGRPFISGNSSQSMRGIRSSYTQRSAPIFRPSSSNYHPGHSAPSDEGLQVVEESYSPHHSRPFSSGALRDRSSRSRINVDRYRSFPDEMVLHDRLTSEGLVIMGRSGFHGSRSPFDQHRDMRLDIEDMSYEELLALEERIGSVSTGLSDNLIPKCLTESIFCTPDQTQDDGKCVICLEEYRNMDEVGTLKVCSHDFHVACIRKWLSVKNLCPICKATALDDKMKQEG